MASITQYRGRTWRALVRKTGFPPLTKTFPTKLAAVAWATEVEARMLRGAHRPVLKEIRAYTVRQLFERFRDEVAPARKTARGERNRINFMLAHAGWVDRRLDQLEPQDLREWRDLRLKQIKPTSVIREMNCIAGIFTHAINEWSIPLRENPMRQVTRPKDADRRRDRRWSEDEIQRFLKVSGFDLKRPPVIGREFTPWVVLLAIETAMRMGELCALTVGDVVLEERCAVLHDTKNGDRRRVPLSRRAEELLKAMTNARAPDEPLIPMTAGTLGVYYRRMCKEAKLVNLRFHDTRHEAATRLSKKLSNVLELGAVTGHRSFKALQRYYNPTPADLAEKLDQ